MISATRMLCQKYTDLTDAEISYQIGRAHV